MTVTEHSFAEEIAPARTFTFLKEVEMLRQNGLALGGSLDNAIVIGDTGVLNSSLRFEDEFVRHKILDLIGDLSLVGHPVVAHAVVTRGGHALHTAMAVAVAGRTGCMATGRGAVGRADASHRRARAGDELDSQHLILSRPQGASNRALFFSGSGLALAVSAMRLHQDRAFLGLARPLRSAECRVTRRLQSGTRHALGRMGCRF